MLSFESTTYRETIYREHMNMNTLLGLKLLSIQHGKCSACKDNSRVKHCPVCFNTRLEPGVLEAITALDLGTKFKENDKLRFENISDDDYSNPPQASYFSHVLERKKKLESLYDELLHTVGTAQETEAMQKLINAAIGG